MFPIGAKIQYFNDNNPNPEKYIFISMFINTPDDLRSLIKEYNPTVNFYENIVVQSSRETES